MYSTADIAKRLGCTAQAVNKYRRKIEKRDGKRLGKPDPTDGRRTLFSEDEVSLIAEMAPKIPVTQPDEDECLEAELIEGDDTTVYTPPSNISLGLRRTALPAVERQRFDVATAEQETADIQHHTTFIAQRGDALLSDFAVGEMVAAAADIKRAIAQRPRRGIALNQQTRRNLEQLEPGIGADRGQSQSERGIGRTVEPTDRGIER